MAKHQVNPVVPIGHRHGVTQVCSIRDHGALIDNLLGIGGHPIRIVGCLRNASTFRAGVRKPHVAHRISGADRRAGIDPD